VSPRAGHAGFDHVRSVAFYGYFADRGTLLAEMLDAWERESVADVLDRIEQEGGDVLDKARLTGRLIFSSDRLLPIDLAVRNWARRDPAVADRLRRVDNQRMQLLRDAISTFCPDPDEIEVRSLLAFCMAIGSHFLAADHPGPHPRPGHGPRRRPRPRPPVRRPRPLTRSRTATHPASTTVAFRGRRQSGTRTAGCDDSPRPALGLPTTATRQPGVPRP
jgi:AcrR family transcriptional regulator